MIVSSFIIQANVITIINYDCQTFIVQATDLFPDSKFLQLCSIILSDTMLF